MKFILLTFLSLVNLISINSCTERDDSPSGTLTVNLINGSTGEPLPNIEGASFGVIFHHENSLGTANNGTSVTLNQGKLKVNLKESHGKISYVELVGNTTATNPFTEKYYTQGNISFAPDNGLEQTQIYYPKAKIKCIVNVTKSENVGKEINLRVIQPNDQKTAIKEEGLNAVYTIKSLKMGEQFILMNSIGDNNNNINWILGEGLPNIKVNLYCKPEKTTELIINL